MTEPIKPLDAEKQALQEFISNARKQQKADVEAVASTGLAKSIEDSPNTIIEEDSEGYHSATSNF